LNVGWTTLTGPMLRVRESAARTVATTRQRSRLPSPTNRGMAGEPWGHPARGHAALRSLTTPQSQPWWPMARACALTAGARGPPVVARRLGRSGSAWRCAPEPRVGRCATWVTSTGCAPHLANDRRGAARLEPARPCAERHVRFEAGACPRGVWRLASLGRPLSPPGVSTGVQRLGDTQRQLPPLLAHQEPRRVRP